MLKNIKTIIVSKCNFNKIPEQLKVYANSISTLLNSTEHEPQEL